MGNDQQLEGMREIMKDFRRKIEEIKPIAPATAEEIWAELKQTELLLRASLAPPGDYNDI